MKYIILAAMLLAGLTGCGSNPQRQEVEVLQPTGAVLYNGPRNLYGTDYNNLTVIYNRQAPQTVVARPQGRPEPVRWTQYRNNREWGNRDMDRRYHHHDHFHPQQPRPPQVSGAVQQPRPQVNNSQQNIQRQPQVQRNPQPQVQRNPQPHPQRVSSNQAPNPRH